MYRSALKTTVAFLLLSLVWMAATDRPARGQEIEVSGQVTSAEDGAALPGVNIVVKGTDVGTATDADGTYALTAPSPNDTLVFSYIGFVEEEVPIDGRSTIDVALTSDTELLDEVVVVGYGEQRRGDVTAAISSVSGADLEESPVATASEALQGRTPGVTIAGDNPGEEPQVRIRGLTTPNTNSPLFVVDGVPTGGTLTVQPSEIESVEVLKDASAASIYGSRAAGGVVLITTKRGTVSDDIRTEISSYVGFQQAWKTIDLLNSEQYIDFWGLGQDPESVPNTDWQDVIFRDALITNQNLAFSGGSETAQYRVSLGYLNQRGIIESSGVERFSLNVNTDFNLGRIEIGESLRLNHMIRDNVFGDAGGRSVLEHTTKMAPYLAPRNPDNLGGFNGPGSADANDAENPLRIQELGTHERQETSLNGNVYGQMKLIEGLSFRTVLGAEVFWANDYDFVPSFYDGNAHNSDQAELTELRTVFFSPLMTNTLTYDQSFGVHNINVVGGVEGQYSLFRSAGVEGQNELTDALQVAGSVASPVAQGSRTRDVLLSSFARVSYNYDSRYLIEGSFRRDGYSRFGPENKFGYFPSVSVGWNVAEEAFMDDSAFDMLKLRGSWGMVGNNNAVGPYETQPTVNLDYNYVDANGNLLSAATVERLANEALQWETTRMMNVGVDVAVLDNSLDFAAEYFRNTSEDVLLEVPVPESFGFTLNPRFNTAEVQTSGFEFILGYRGESGAFSWDVTANFGTQSNEVTNLGRGSPILGARYEAPSLDITRVTEGEPIYHFYGYKMDGLYQEDDITTCTDESGETYSCPVEGLAHRRGVQPGDIKFMDISGPDGEPDGVIDDNDRTNIGDPMPDYTYGLNAALTWNDLDLSILFQGAGGHQIYRAWAYWTRGMTREFNTEVEVYENHWTPENTDTDIPRNVGGDPAGNARSSDRWVEDGDYLRLKEITLGYTVPTSFSNTLQRFRIYVQSRNALTFTGYDGFDPEVGVWSNDADDFTSDYGVDFGQMPQPRTFTFGVQLGF